MKSSIHNCLDRGFHTVSIGARGLQGVEQYTSIELDCFSKSSDIREVVEYVHWRFCDGKNRQLFAIGFSISGFKLTRMLAEDGELTKLTAAFICNAPLISETLYQAFLTKWHGLLNKAMGDFG